jgi:hypothetical protein
MSTAGRPTSANVSPDHLICVQWTYRCSLTELRASRLTERDRVRCSGSKRASGRLGDRETGRALPVGVDDKRPVIRHHGRVVILQAEHQLPRVVAAAGFGSGRLGTGGSNGVEATWEGCPNRPTLKAWPPSGKWQGVTVADGQENGLAGVEVAAESNLRGSPGRGGSR